MKRKGLLFAVSGLLLLGLVASSAFAGGSQEGRKTALEVSKTPRVYIAPGNPASNNTRLHLDANVVPGTGKVIKSYELTVYDTAGDVVWTKAETETQSRGFFGNLFNIGQEPQISPKTIEDLSWPGVDKNDKPVPDGDYIYQLTLIDSAGTVVKSPPLNVTVDNTAPVIDSVKATYTIFSPNGDGVRDTLPITQSGSREVSWHGVFKDESGNVVREFKWDNPIQYDPAKPTVQEPQKDQTPPDFSWDGKNISGSVVPDGTYTYTLVGKDRAGNTTESTPITITLSSKAGNMGLKATNPAFSPNGDGIKDSTDLDIRVTDQVGLLNWKVDIAARSAPDKVLRFYSGTGSPPSSVHFDGKDSDGQLLSDGAYVAVLSGEYENGKISQSEPLDLTIDTKAPQATLTATPRVFGGSNGPTTTIDLKADWSANWTGVLEYAGGKIEVPASRYNVGPKDFPFVWNGQDFSGNPVPDGKYTIYVVGTDAAGNTGESNRVVIGKLTGPTPISLSLADDAFSPNGDGSKDTATINTVAKYPEFVAKSILTIKNSAGDVVRTSETGKASDTFVWDGRTNTGTVVPDGEYTVDLEDIYQNGNDMKATTGPLTVDTKAPTIEATADNPIFSPNGDGVKDTVTITQTSSTEKQWVGKILNSQGKAVREYTWQGQVQNFVWDGTDAQGNKVPNGPYTYVVETTDPAGNIGIARIKLNVDTFAGIVGIEPQSDGFSPNGDGIMDTMDFKITLDKSQGVKSWMVTFVNDEKGDVQSISGGATVPDTVSWNGKTKLGFILDGTYHAQFAVTYDNGAVINVESKKSFVVDTTPPRASIDVNPVPFSPDGDGINDTVTLTLHAEQQAADIARWNLDILDPVGHTFISYDGTGAPPSTIVWDGKAKSGELVQSGMDYSAVLTLTDKYGVTGTGGAVVSVDILVIKEGNHYRIRVPSIYFGPNTSDLFLVDPKLLDKNLETLRRLAKILNRYGSYNILIQGNAVSVLYYDPKAAAEEQKETLIPLSRARAREVMKALAILGVDRHRISIEGLGGSNPIVPFSDLQNRWKDRRVEFLLTSKPGAKPTGTGQ